MAFLCPVRIKRSKKKKPLHDVDGLNGGGASSTGANGGGPAPSMGRITGSASIETLVRVGIEKENGLSPESKMVVLHDFTPCVDDELEVKRGQIVHVLYQENDWVYVISEENKEGFIPHSYCAQYGSQLATLALNVKKKMPRDPNANQSAAVVPPPQPGQQNQGGMNRATSMNAIPTGGLTSPSLTSAGGGGGAASQQQQNQFQQQQEANNNNSQLRSESRNLQKEPDHFGVVPVATSSQQQQRGGGGGPPLGGGPLLQPPRGSGNSLDPSRSSSLMSDSNSSTQTPDAHPFYKEPSGRYVVLYSYRAQDENDLAVERGQVVTVLNSEDPDWFWVSLYDQCEGFVPSGFIYPLDAIQKQQTTQIIVNNNNPGNNSSYVQKQRQQQPQPQQQFGNANRNFEAGGGGRGSKMDEPMAALTSAMHGMNSNGLPVAPPSTAAAQNGIVVGPNGYNQLYRPTQGQGGGPTQPPLGSSGCSSGPSSFGTSQQQTNINNSRNVTTQSPAVHGLSSTSATPTMMNQGGVGGGPPGPPPSSGGMPPPPSTQNPPPGGEHQVEDFRYNGTELVMLYDYKAQAPDDLTVRRGDWVYADLSNQTVDGWLWCYSPKTRKYGFIPKAYARPPAMTSL